MNAKLIICPTPIGNLGDITARTLDALRSADVVCAEDTRVTGKLLAHFDIHKRLERLDEATISTQAERIVARIANGETIAFCSDAGMPGVSDPGARLVRAAQGAGVKVEVLPGASAATTAYVASGFSNPAYFFGGFFPRKDSERSAVLNALAALDAVLLFYESPNRLVDALACIEKVFPHREVCVARELTKLHEEVYRGASAAVLDEFSRREANGGVKGEIVIVIGPPTQAEAQEAHDNAASDAKSRAQQLLAEEGLSKKDVVARLKSEFGISRNEAYEIVHSL